MSEIFSRTLGTFSQSSRLAVIRLQFKQRVLTGHSVGGVGRDRQLVEKASSYRKERTDTGSRNRGGSDGWKTSDLSP